MSHCTCESCEARRARHAESPTILNIPVASVKVDADQFGEEFAIANDSKQAAILSRIADVVGGFNWSMQCRFIAESMTDEQCFRVRMMLDELVGHLEAIPRERAVEAKTDEIVGAVREAISGT